MSVLQSRINTRDESFETNRAHMQAQVDDLRQLVDRIRQGGGPRAQERHLSRGKLLPRERASDDALAGLAACSIAGAAGADSASPFAAGAGSSTLQAAAKSSRTAAR